MNQETLGFIASGNLYVSGKDKDECTNVYISFSPKISSVELTEYLDFLQFFLLLVRNVTCVPGYQERINIIISLIDRESSKAFMLHFLDRLRVILIVTFPFAISKIIFLGDLVDIEEKYRDFKRRLSPFCEVMSIKEDEMDELLDMIHPDQLENKYGGDKPDLPEYWPPRTHTPPGQAIDEEEMGKMMIIPLFIFEEDYEKFRRDYMLTEIQIQKRLKPNQLRFKKGKVILFSTGRTSSINSWAIDI